MNTVKIEEMIKKTEIELLKESDKTKKLLLKAKLRHFKKLLKNPLYDLPNFNEKYK